MENLGQWQLDLDTFDAFRRPHVLQLFTFFFCYISLGLRKFNFQFDESKVHATHKRECVTHCPTVGLFFFCLSNL